jgi:hypothetical protein
MMQKWEYRVFNFHHDPPPADGAARPAPYWMDDKSSSESPEERLNRMGAEGWELASISQHPFDMAYVMKRPKNE